MIVLTDADSIPRRALGAVVTIGNFDGVHRGHRKILRGARSLALARGLRTLILTFTPHPVSVLSPERAPILLTTEGQRRGLLGEEGLDFLYEERFDRDLAALSPEAWFNRILLERFAVAGIVVGENFHFGHDRAGSVRTLHDLARPHRIHVEPVPVELLPDGTPISSSRIRTTLNDGDVEGAGRMLGRPYFLEGTGVRGGGRGASLGWATANIEPVNALVPGDGVYITQAEVAGKRRPSITNIGVRPTFGENRRIIETHLLGFGGMILDETVRLHFHRRLRDEMKFASVEDLKARIAEDVAVAGEFFRERGSTP